MPSVVYHFKSKFSNKVLRIISIVCGIFIVVYGCKLFVSGIQFVRSIEINSYFYLKYIYILL